MPRSAPQPRIAALTLLCTLFLSFNGPASASDNEELEARVDVLAEEIAHLREQLAIPETDEELGSAYGMGPAASKVYGSSRGVAVGGYGEFYFEDTIDGDNTADMYRFITYVGYKFSDKIVMNTEIEFEHATTDENYEGKAGGISVEFSYLDFLLHENFNVRAGNLLVPMGFVNELHEPPFYRGNFRPTIERSIIPSTWHELGTGAHGKIGESFRYTAYLLNGMNASNFDAAGVRGGRQNASRVIWNDLGGVAALNFESARFGGSVSGYYGGADQGLLAGDISVSNWVGEAHAWWRGAGLEVRGLIATSGIDGAEELGVVLGETIPEQQLGWYLEAAYDIAPLFTDNPGVRFEPWIRFEDYNLQHAVADGLVADDSLDRTSLTAGVHFMPHPQVVLKAEWEHLNTASDADESLDEVRVGAGFVY
jgi:hypothetical protein